MNEDLRFARARIAELEAERDRLAERVRHAEGEIAWMKGATGVPPDEADRPNASAWLAERTAELKEARAMNESPWVEIVVSKNARIAAQVARISELEAERNGLKAALAQIAECRGTTLRGPFASGDAGRWHEVGARKAFDQCAALARAALSEPSGEEA